MAFMLMLERFHPIKNNNTNLLVIKKGWSGINIDLDKINIDLFKISRPKISIFLVQFLIKKEKVYFYHQKSALIH